METLAILAAAGQGQRMGAERPKAFLDLAGESLLVRAAGAFERAPSVDGIVAVVPEAELELARKKLDVGEYRSLRRTARCLTQWDPGDLVGAVRKLTGDVRTVALNPRRPSRRFMTRCEQE